MHASASSARALRSKQLHLTAGGLCSRRRLFAVIPAFVKEAGLKDRNMHSEFTPERSIVISVTS